MGIEFACKVFSIDKVLKCSFGLNNTEFRILRFLFKKDLTVSELSVKLNKNKSTIQRSLQKMINKQLVTKHQRNLKRGGYVFYYRAVSKDKIKERINQIFDGFKQAVTKAVHDW